MDGARRQLYSPHIRRVLQSFQSNALRTLSGPTSSTNKPWMADQVSVMTNFQTSGVLDLSKPQPNDSGFNVKKLQDMDRYKALRVALPIQPPPFFSTMDTTRCEKSETFLEGESIACFIVGGEKRLCLPQILHTVLREFTLPQIDNVCDDLHIFCSRCNDEQLQILKMLRILPLTAQSCGLVTKTDAERLCHSLIHKNSCKSGDARKPSSNFFRVYHECFGKCMGEFHPDLYTKPEAKCIMCSACGAMFSPSKFVCHSHKSLENRTCHWGFDSANWRSYMMVAKNQEADIGKLQELLEYLKARFDHDRTYKRRQSTDADKSDQKRSKYDEAPASHISSLLGNSQTSVPSSAFRPWSPGSLPPTNCSLPPHTRESYAQAVPAYLQTGPPVLLNPERVIRHSETDRYERHFAPNVSLAPIAPQKVKDSSGEGFGGDPSDVPHTDVFSPTSSHNSYLSSPLSDKMADSSLLIESTLERELELVRQALSRCEVTGPDAELTDKSFQEFSLLRARHEEQWSKATRMQVWLQKEVDALQREVAEATLLRKQTMHEMKRLQEDTEKRSKEENEHKDRLLIEIDSLQKDKEKCASMKRDADNKVADMEAMCKNLQHEVVWYRQELSRTRGTSDESGLKSPAKLPSPHLTNGNVASPPEIRSPTQSPSSSPPRLEAKRTPTIELVSVAITSSNG